MKKLKLLLLLAVTLIPFCDVLGQDCVRLIRTKYDSSLNIELSPFFPSKVNPWENNFDFAAIDNGTAFFDIQLNPTAGWIIPGLSGNGFKMKSPFSVAMASQYDYLSQPFGAGSSVYDADIWWEDGWELMWLNTGYFPNMEAINIANPNRILSGAYSLSNPRTPYIILYNRYQGKLRVFANLFTDFNTFNDVRTSLTYSDPQNTSGIFRHLLNYDQTLDEPSIITEVSSMNHNENNNTLWWSSDFQLGYDPCVCEKQSDIDFKFKAIKSSNINLDGRIVQQDMDLSVLGNPEYKNFLSNESISSMNTQKGGSLLFKRFDSLLVKHDRELELYNTQLNSYNSFFNSSMRQLIKSTKDAIANAAGPFNPTSLGDFALRQLVQINGASKFDTTVAEGFAKEVNKTAKGQLGKSFDFLSVAAFGDDYFKEPQRPVMPTATFGEMKIAGTISDTGAVNVSSFMTPGSYKYPQQLTVFNYPAYNEAVGLYALLRKPVVKGFEDKNTVRTLLSLDTILIDTSVFLGNTDITIVEREANNWDQNHKLFLRVDEPLKYKLNRALDFDDEKTKLYVSFVVELENNIPNGDNCFTLHMKDNSENFYLRDVFPIVGTTAYQLFYETTWKDMEDIGDALFTLDFKNSFQPVSQRTSHITFTSTDTIISIGPLIDCIDENITAFTIKKIKMKVAADMYFQQKAKNGLQNNNFQTFTYLLYDPEHEIDLISHAIDSPEVQRFKQPDLVLTNETIETTDPFVMEVIGNTIVVNAKTIELNGTIDVQSGFTAQLQATKSIKGISGTTTISRDIHLKNVPGFSTFGKNYETTPEDLKTFCQSKDQGYKANVAASKAGEVEEEESTDKEMNNVIQTLVYPNPASHSFFVSVSADDEKEYHFAVYDLTGRTLINETVKGSNQPQFEITTEALVGGTYILRVSTADGAVNETQRIVIIK